MKQIGEHCNWLMAFWVWMETARKASVEWFKYMWGYKSRVEAPFWAEKQTNWEKTLHWNKQTHGMRATTPNIYSLPGGLVVQW